jgi:hypothetical protein
MLGSSNVRDEVSLASSLVVVQATMEWPDSSVSQDLCQAGCLLKRRLAVGKITYVFAVLSNGQLFRFFAIDTDGVVYASGFRLLELGDDGTNITSCLKFYVGLLGS